MLCNLQGLTYDENGEVITRSQSTTFIVNGKTNNSFKGNSNAAVGILPAPKRNPDYTAICKTNTDQAALYRLSGGKIKIHLKENR